MTMAGVVDDGDEAAVIAQVIVVRAESALVQFDVGKAKCGVGSMVARAVGSCTS
jgi:hypothetical protein